MTDQHPITPPPELKQQLRENAPRYHINGSECREHWLIEHACQWGYDQRGEVNEAKLQQARDQELEACCELLDSLGGDGEMIRRYRRPKAPSLKEQAWKLLECYGTSGVKLTADQCNTIREALEELSNG